MSIRTGSAPDTGPFVSVSRPVHLPSHRAGPVGGAGFTPARASTSLPWFVWYEGTGGGARTGSATGSRSPERHAAARRIPSATKLLFLKRIRRTYTLDARACATRLVLRFEVLSSIRGYS